MPRKPFNITCDVFKGPGTATPGLFVGSFPCRYVVEDGIHSIGPGCPPIPAYLTIQGYQPQGCWTYPFFGVNSDLCDRISIPSGFAPNYFVLYTDVILWRGQIPYFRAYLVYLPVPPTAPEGGIVFGGSAIVVTIPPFTSGGGIVFGGAATVVFNPPLVSYGGILFGGSAIVTTVPPFITYGGILLGGDTSGSVSRMRIVIGSGGILFGGSATVVFTPGPTDYILDHFTDTNGTSLTSHTPDIGGAWTTSNAAYWIQGNKCKQNGVNVDLTKNAISIIDAAHADVSVEVKFTSPASGGYSAGVAMRCTDKNNFINVFYENVSNALKIQLWNGGVPSVPVANTSVTLSTSTTYTLKATVSGANYTAEIVGFSSVISGNILTFITNTNFGLSTYLDSGTFSAQPDFDDFRVYP